MCMNECVCRCLRIFLEKKIEQCNVTIVGLLAELESESLSIKAKTAIRDSRFTRHAV